MRQAGLKSNKVSNQNKSNTMQNSMKTTVSPACRKADVSRSIARLVCWFVGHKKVGKVCQRCKYEFGMPVYENPPPCPTNPSVSPEMLFDKEFGELLRHGFMSAENYTVAKRHYCRVFREEGILLYHTPPKQPSASQRFLDSMKEIVLGLASLCPLKSKKQC